MRVYRRYRCLCGHRYDTFAPWFFARWTVASGWRPSARWPSLPRANSRIPGNGRLNC